MSKLKTFVKESIRANIFDTGWGNGYVIIPKGHKLYGKSYAEIHGLIPDLEVHGGLTFAESTEGLNWFGEGKITKDEWIVGFDTAHYNDDKMNWPQAKVRLETEKLKEQLENYENNI